MPDLEEVTRQRGSEARNRRPGKRRGRCGTQTEAHEGGEEHQVLRDRETHSRMPEQSV
ncbi:MAG: hypothetical protein LBC94_00005 [Desulfovibrio sp.]|nr:hypothetical protein [Desulfovibrio sp.]